MAERTEDVQAHWTRPGVLARIEAALTELGHDPQNLSPETLATREHLHSGGLATTRRQANRIAVTEDSRVLDVGCGIGGPARYLAHTYGCRVDGIDLTPELIETGRVLTERCKLADRVVLQVGTCLQSRWILRAKRLEILRELVPDFTRLAIVANVGNPGAVLEDARGRGSGPSARSANRPTRNQAGTGYRVARQRRVASERVPAIGITVSGATEEERQCAKCQSQPYCLHWESFPSSRRAPTQWSPSRPVCGQP